MTPDQPVRQLLEQLAIAYHITEHVPVMTSHEAQFLCDQLPGAHVKNLFLKSDQGNFVLVTLRHQLRLDLKAFSAVLGIGRFSFGKAEDLIRLLGVQPGSVSPLGVLHDTAHEVLLVLDDGIKEYEVLNVHPLRNDMTVTLGVQDLCGFVQHTGHEVQFVELPIKID